MSFFLFFAIGLQPIYGQQAILLEKFTNVYCGACPGASVKIEELVHDNPEIIWVNHYKPVDWTDNPLENDQSLQLWFDLNLPGVPMGMINRIPINNRIYHTSGNWPSLIEEAKNQEHQLDISFKALSYDYDASRLEFNVEVKALKDIDVGSLNLTVYIVEDSVKYKQHSYFNTSPGHPLEGRGDIIWDYKHHHVVRAILDDAWGSTQGVPDILKANETYSFSYTHILEEKIKPTQVNLVAAVTTPQSSLNNAYNVINANRIFLRDLDLQLSSVDLKKQDLVFKVYPNPATDNLRIRLNAIPKLLEIINYKGQSILEIKPQTRQVDLDISELVAGPYVLRVIDENYQGTTSFLVE